MFGRAKTEFTELQGQLENWQREVPDRAQRFHRQLSELIEELDLLLKRWLLWVGNTERDQLKNRGRRLLGIAGGLKGLIQEAAKLREEVQRLELRSPDVDEVDLAEWLRERCRQWEIELDNFGRHTDRYNELMQEQSALKRLEMDLQLHTRAIDVLHEAGAVRSSLEGLDVAPLEARLPEFVARLRAEGPTQEQIGEFRAVLDPLKETADRIRQPPPALQSVSSLLNELRGWARELGERQEVKQLDERRGFYAVEWIRRDASEIDALKEEAEKLLKEYFDRAHEMRKEKLQQLEQEMRGFFEVCGHHPELEQKLEALRRTHQRIDRPQLHPRWLADYDRDRDFFKAIAESRLNDLGSRLASLCETLEQGLETLAQRSLSAEVKKELSALAYETKKLKQMSEVEAILGGLRKSRHFELELEALESRAQQESQEFEEELEQLGQRYQQLQASAQAVSMTVDDLSRSIQDLSDGSLSLEEARQQIAKVTEQLTMEEHRFASQALRLSVDCEQESRELLRVLGRTGAAIPKSTLPEITTSDRPEAVAEALQLYREFHKQLEQELAVQLVNFTAQIQNHLTKLEAVPRQKLSVGDRDVLEQVVTALQESTTQRSSTPRQQLEDLLELVTQSELFYEQLQREELEALEHRQSLTKRWREFKSLHLRRYLPEIGDRVEALIEGLPQNTPNWLDFREQLDLAEQLFERLDRQARRLAARDLEEGLTALRQKVKHATHEDERQKILDLLTEIDALENRRLPSATLRMKVRGAQRSVRRQT